MVLYQWKQSHIYLLPKWTMNRNLPQKGWLLQAEAYVWPWRTSWDVLGDVNETMVGYTVSRNELLCQGRWRAG